MNDSVRLVLSDANQSRSEVVVGRRSWEELGTLWETVGPVAVVADHHTGALVDSAWAEQARYGYSVCRIPAGEVHKSVETAAGVYRHLAGRGFTRDGCLLAVGGGVVTDLTGFVAATYLRGVAWVAMPTTLLAQVDAAVGGKTGVNLPEGKNLVGAFHLPRLVLVDPGRLASLPPREWRSGLGEVVKSALIAGGTLWESLTDSALPAIGDADDPRWETVVAETIRIKVEIVQRDPREAGERMFLNFGHTLGHALEQLLGYGSWTHGEAVGVGSLVALALSEQRLGLDPGVRRTVRGWLTAWGMPTRVPELDRDRLLPLLARDKKNRRSGLRWILLEQPGRPQIVPDVPMEEVEAAMAAVNRDR